MDKGCEADGLAAALSQSPLRRQWSDESWRNGSSGRTQSHPETRKYLQSTGGTERTRKAML